MGNAVAIPAFCHIYHHPLSVRLPVTPTTSRNLFVRGMALDTPDSRMFCLFFLQQVVSLAMAAGANGRQRLLIIRYTAWLVRWVTGHTVF